eukprot:TRINITY_DN9708_c0_g1_i1.p1 TRINITY_DN9708_c0_g1~~TRINITY_DN9708_c0_g1_i1.p1  ORF type:complete len:301 (+),score=81.95 TRINITY_DN9708_c0_g1_i1:51-953(+)
MAAMAAVAGSLVIPARSSAAVVGGKLEASFSNGALRMAVPLTMPASDARAAPLFASHVVAHSSMKAARRLSVSAMATEIEAEPAAETEAPAPAAIDGPAKLYVGNLPFNVDSESLAEIFQDFGSVELVEVIHDRETGRSRGFAFVTMTTMKDAQSAIEKLDGSELGGRTMKVNFPLTAPRDGERRAAPERRRTSGAPRSNPSGGSSNKLYVGNLSWGMDDLGLEDLFSEFGKVLEAKVVLDRESGRSRGFGFVTLASSNEVQEAIGGLDGVEVDGRTLRVNVAEQKAPGSRGGFRDRGDR